MCNYCNAEYYIKTQKYVKSYFAPMTLEGQLRQQLEDLTGEQFLIIPNQYCPMCGANLKEVGGMNESET